MIPMIPKQLMAHDSCDFNRDNPADAHQWTFLLRLLGIITNGLGIRDITFITRLPSGSSGYRYLKRNLILQMNTNLGDAAFDAIKIYKTLFEKLDFRRLFPPEDKATIEGLTIL